MNIKYYSLHCLNLTLKSVFVDRFFFCVFSFKNMFVLFISTITHYTICLYFKPILILNHYLQDAKNIASNLWPDAFDKLIDKIIEWIRSFDPVRTI